MNDSLDIIDMSDSAFVRSLKKDLRVKAKNISSNEARYLVKMYYQFQRDRMRMANRVTANSTNDSEPMHIVTLFQSQFQNLEQLMIPALESFVKNSAVGEWLISNKGVGPVLAAGLLANFDVKQASTAAKFWAFAGYDPTLAWDAKMHQWVRRNEKLVARDYSDRTKTKPFFDEELKKWVTPMGTLQPFSKDAKTLCYKVGKSFVMVGKGEIYRERYDLRKEYETLRNANFEYKDQAFEILKRISNGKAKVTEQDVHVDSFEDVVTDVVEGSEGATDTATYRETLAKGMLVPGHIDARARRYAVQLFLSHFHHVAYENEFKTKAPMPYIIQHGGHVDYIPVPNYVSPY